MTHRLKKFGASTALVTLMALVPQGGSAQTIPGCNPNADPIDVADLTPEALGKVKMEEVPLLLEGNTVCVGKNGTLKKKAPVTAGGPAAVEESAPEQAQAGNDAPEQATEQPDEAQADAAPVEQPEQAEAETEQPDVMPEPADTASGAPDAASEAANPAPEQANGSDETPEPAAQPEATAESEPTDASEPTAAAEADAPSTDESVNENATAETGGNATGSGAPADAKALAESLGNGDASATGAAPATEEPQAEETAEGNPEPAAEPEPEPETATAEPEAPASTDEDTTTAADAETDAPVTGNVTASGEAGGRPAAAEAASESDAEAVETTEMKVTEENSRSSDEDFKETTTAETTTSNDDDDDGGLSNFEKFALGAAGLIVLDQLIGDNEKVVENTGDRVVVQRDDGQLYVLKDDDVLLRRPGSDVRTETFSDGSTRTTVVRPNGVKVVTISAVDGQVLRRTRILPDGREILLFDDTQGAEPVEVSELPPPPAQEIRIEPDNEDALRAALASERRADLNRTFTLSQVRNIKAVRELMPEINIDAINFETGSAAIRPQEAEDLYDLGTAMSEFIAENPDELFLIEGHTDAVGGDALNLALSDRRAESVALALAEYFDVPPENMVVQGYGEEFLLVPTDGPERSNRRATVRRITPLLQVASSR